MEGHWFIHPTMVISTLQENSNDTHTCETITRCWEGRAKPGSAYVQPVSPYVQPMSLYVHPGSPYVQPVSPYVQPGSPYVQPWSPYVQPMSPYVHPGSPYVQPVSPYVQTGSPYVQPTSPYVQPWSPYVQYTSIVSLPPPQPQCCCTRSGGRLASCQPILSPRLTEQRPQKPTDNRWRHNIDCSNNNEQTHTQTDRHKCPTPIKLGMTRFTCISW